MSEPATPAPTKPVFPAPAYFGRQRAWKLSALLAYEAALDGLPAPDPLPPEREKFFTAAMVRSRYGVSDMWLHRREVERRDVERRATEAA